MKDVNKFSALPDGDKFGPKFIFVGDEVRFIKPDSTQSTIGTVTAIPSFSFVDVKTGDNKYRGTIYRDRITAVFPKFK